MKIAVVLVAQDTDILEFFAQRRASVVPRELRKKTTEFNVITFRASCSNEELFDLLLDAHKKHSAVGILIEASNKGRLKDFSCALFVKTFDALEAKVSLQNYFSHHMTRWLKNLLFVSQTFADGKQRKCLLLPYQSFAAPELAEIFQLCRTQSDDNRFTELLETNLKAIRKRSIPKKGKSGKRHFLKDNKGRYFELGKEKHGQSGTHRPPHAFFCALSASARFGITLDRNLHFNVSVKNGQISGEFENCHAD